MMKTFAVLFSIAVLFVAFFLVVPTPVDGCNYGVGYSTAYSYMPSYSASYYAAPISYAPAPVTYTYTTIAVPGLMQYQQVPQAPLQAAPCQCQPQQQQQMAPPPSPARPAAPAPALQGAANQSQTTMTVTTPPIGLGAATATTTTTVQQASAPLLTPYTPGNVVSNYSYATYPVSYAYQPFVPLLYGSNYGSYGYGVYAGSAFNNFYGFGNRYGGYGYGR